MIDFEVTRSSRHCAASGRELAEGEEFYSVLVQEGGDIRRQDYSAECWVEPTAPVVGWWKSRVPVAAAKRARMAPSDVLVEYFNALERVADKQDARYVLSLVLIRRRVLRLEETIRDETGREVLVLYRGRDESTHHVPVLVPSDERARRIQDELNQLLFAGAV